MDSLSNPNGDATYANPIDTTTYTVIVSDANNCTASDSIKINVNPSLKIDLTSDKSFLCYGDTAQLNAYLIDSGTLGTPVGHVFEWLETDSLSDSTLLNPYANPTSSIVYQIRVTDGKLCTDEDHLYIRVNPALSVEAGEGDTVCAWESVQLNAMVVDSGTLGVPAPFGYLWSPSKGLNNEAVQNPLANTDTTTMYYVEVVDSNLCTAIDSVEIKVSPPILVNIGNDTSICYKEVISLNGQISAGIPPYSFTWTPATLLSNPNILNPQSTPLDTTEYVLMVLDSNSCTASDTMMVYVNPPFEIDVQADTNFLCFGDSTLLKVDTLNLNGGSPPYNILWSPSDSLSSTNFSIVRANPTDSTMYYVEMVDSSGCAEYDSILIGVNPSLEIELTADTSFICFGDSLDLNVQLIGPGTPGIPTSHIYVWNPVDSISDTTILSPFANPTQNTDYTMTIIDGNLCSFTDSITILVNPELSVDVGGDVTICENQNHILNAQITNPGTPGSPAAHSYNWSNANLLNNATVYNPSATPDSTTVFAVTVTDSKSCSAEDSMILFVHVLAAYSGLDDTVCKNGSINLNAISNGDVYWYDNGANGVFLPSQNGLNVTYEPHLDSVGDKIISIVVTDPLGVCVNYIIDTMLLHIAPNPIGSTVLLTDSICSMDTIDIGGSIINAQSVSWTDNSLGGSFLLPLDSISNKYVPSQMQSGSVFLSMISYGSSYCPSDTSHLYFDVQSSPRVELDSAYRICQRDSVALSPQFFNAQSPYWTDSSMGALFRGHAGTDICE